MNIRVGIAGYGAGGAAFHGPVVRAVEGLDLVAVSTSNPDRAPPGTRRYEHAEALIADPEIDLVVVAAPHPAHFPLARAALEAGKHVVVDKPFTIRSEEAEALAALAGARGRLVVPFHNRRWDGDFITIRDLIESGELGEIMLYEAHWDRFRPDRRPGWRDLPGPGSGLIYDLGPHLIDQALVLFGPPDSVAADLEIQRAGMEINDYFELGLRYGRKRVVLACSTLLIEPRPRFSVHGTKGSFVKFGLDPQEAALKAGADPLEPGFGEEDPDWFGTLTRLDGTRARIATRPGRYADFYRAVADAIRTNGRAPVDPVDAAAGLRIIEAALAG
ncbi:MAG: oxidoreductase [Alphaproteobacteria bacterium]|nr:oxidoreductase [Alphaproteobacteria bacterium]